MFSYRYEACADEPIVSDKFKKALGWIAAFIAVGFMWTLPAWLMVWGVI